MKPKTTLFIILLMTIATTQAQRVEDFSLQSATTDSQFKLSDHKGQFVALHFLLKTECPYCIRHTAEYIENAANFPEVVHIFIKPDSNQEIQQWASKLINTDSDPYPIYRDTNSRLAKQFDIPNGYNFHGQTVHYPALILLDQSGTELFRYVGKNNRDRYSFEEFSNTINNLLNTD